MMKKVFKFLVLVVVAIVISSCSTLNHTMREPNSRVDFKKEDFVLSEQVSADATTVKVFCIDWARLFKKESGEIDNGLYSSVSIPVIGDFVSDKTANYSLYELMANNSGYDVVFYPQYVKEVKKPVLGLGFIVKITNVKTTARLGKLK